MTFFDRQVLAAVRGGASGSSRQVRGAVLRRFAGEQQRCVSAAAVRGALCRLFRRRLVRRVGADLFEPAGAVAA